MCQCINHKTWHGTFKYFQINFNKKLHGKSGTNLFVNKCFSKGNYLPVYPVGGGSYVGNYTTQKEYFSLAVNT